MSTKDLSLITELKTVAISRQQYSVAARLRQIEKALRKDLNREYTEEIIEKVIREIKREYGQQEEKDIL